VQDLQLKQSYATIHLISSGDDGGAAGGGGELSQHGGIRRQPEELQTGIRARQRLHHAASISPGQATREYKDHGGRINIEENPGSTRAPCFIPTNSWTS
jgi:hypothetical protein